MNRLVEVLIASDSTMMDFLMHYNNFHYYNALDGHESVSDDLTLLNELRIHIGFHEKI